RRPLLPAGARGAKPRDDGGAVPARRRPTRDHAGRRGAADELRGRPRAGRTRTCTGAEGHRADRRPGTPRTRRARPRRAALTRRVPREQREEVASMTALLAVIDRAGADHMLLVEDYLARTGGVAAAEPSTPAPSAAGGAL